MPEFGVAPPGYRLPEATTLGRVVLQVSDLARSTMFYEQVLGLRVGGRDDTAVHLSPAGDPRTIVELRSGPGVRALGGPRLGLYHFAVLLPSRADLGAFVQHLGSLEVHAGTADHLVSEALYLKDPDNLGIEVYADRPRNGWLLNGTELAMASDPLDVAGLAAAAGGRPWAGMPAGTVLGHVHLHVGNLDAGAAFYHEALGLDKVVWSYPGALFLSAGGYHHHLGINTWARGAIPAAADDARLVEWEVVVPGESDLDAAAESLQRSGATIERGDRSVRATDPWGTRLRLRSA